MGRIDPLIHEMLDQGASDLHLAEGQPPKIRRHGHLVTLDHPVLTEEVMLGYLEEICEPERWQRFLETRDIDFACSVGEGTRFRTNFFYQAHGLAAVMRVIPTRIKTLDELGLPPVLKNLSLLRSGLVLVTGPGGSGKSTTLAAILDLVNETSIRHILTLEEPIEFVQANKRSIVSQREVGIDVASFADGLRVGGRQDCDVIMVGELRDYETMSLALLAASMGVLVFATLQTISAVKTIDRVIDAFPPGKQPQARSMLADCLRAVSSQILLRSVDGESRVPCVEILLWNQALANTIREGNTPNIRNIIQGARGEGMQLMDDSILKVLQENRITGEEAHLKATDKARFQKFTQAEPPPL